MSGFLLLQGNIKRQRATTLDISADIKLNKHFRGIWLQVHLAGWSRINRAQINEKQLAELFLSERKPHLKSFNFGITIVYISLLLDLIPFLDN